MHVQHQSQVLMKYTLSTVQNEFASTWVRTADLWLAN